MYDYFCIKCLNIVGKWKYKYSGFDIKKYCNIIKEDDDSDSVKVLSCKKCGNTVGVACYNVCIKCFGDITLFGGEKKFSNWFEEYKKTQISINDTKACYICTGTEFRKEPQPWFYKTSTTKKASKEHGNYNNEYYINKILKNPILLN